jgi:hypothetical protein
MKHLRSTSSKEIGIGYIVPPLIIDVIGLKQEPEDIKDVLPTSKANEDHKKQGPKRRRLQPNLVLKGRS